MCVLLHCLKIRLSGFDLLMAWFWPPNFVLNKCFPLMRSDMSHAMSHTTCLTHQAKSCLVVVSQPIIDFANKCSVCVSLFYTTPCNNQINSLCINMCCNRVVILYKYKYHFFQNPNNLFFTLIKTSKYYQAQMNCIKALYLE